MTKRSRSKLLRRVRDRCLFLANADYPDGVDVFYGGGYLSVEGYSVDDAEAAVFFVYWGLPDLAYRQRPWREVYAEIAQLIDEELA